MIQALTNNTRNVTTGAEAGRPPLINVTTGTRMKPKVRRESNQPSKALMTGETAIGKRVVRAQNLHGAGPPPTAMLRPHGKRKLTLRIQTTTLFKERCQPGEVPK